MKFDELSDGQRCLIALYMLLEQWSQEGGTLFIDEPENYLMLVELQPWMHATTERVDDAHQILVISHHPEWLDAWAVPSGIHLRREAGSYTRWAPFEVSADSDLSPSELIARGWAPSGRGNHEKG